MTPAGGPAAGLGQQAKNDSFAVLTPRLQDPQRAIAGAKAERPFPERSSARSADGGSLESHAPAEIPESRRRSEAGLDGARIKAKGVRSGDSDSGPSGQGRPATVSREERRRSGSWPGAYSIHRQTTAADSVGRRQAPNRIAKESLAPAQALRRGQDCQPVQ